MEFSKDGDNLLSANRYIPYPEKYKDLDDKAKIARAQGDYSFKDGFNSGGYEWCVANWGTKWGMYNIQLVQDNYSGKRSKAVYRFDSAWSPAIPVIMAMSTKYPDLRFKLKYYERGAAFKGVFEVRGGRVLSESRSDYKGMRGG